MTLTFSNDKFLGQAQKATFFTTQGFMQNFY